MLKKIKNFAIEEFEFDLKTKIAIICFACVVGAFYGFVYETIFYKIDLGYFVKRGTSFGPWIPIYAFGTLLIMWAVNKIKDNPFAVFSVSTIASGILEYLTGYVLLKMFNIRLWDYNTEIWNFGNINGYVCLRSVLFFGLSGLALTYLIIPIIKRIANKVPTKLFNIISYSIFSIMVVDFIISQFI